MPDPVTHAALANGNVIEDDEGESSSEDALELTDDIDEATDPSSLLELLAPDDSSTDSSLSYMEFSFMDDWDDDTIKQVATTIVDAVPSAMDDESVPELLEPSQASSEDSTLGGKPVAWAAPMTKVP